jgi:hypothetical protein
MAWQSVALKCLLPLLLRVILLLMLMVLLLLLRPLLPLLLLCGCGVENPLHQDGVAWHTVH